MNEFKPCQAGGDAAMGLLERHRAGGAQQFQAHGQKILTWRKKGKIWE